MGPGVGVIGRHAAAVDAVVVGPGGELVSSSRDGTIRWWNADLVLRPGLRRPPHGAIVLAAGPELVYGTTDGELGWVDWRTGETVRRVPAMDPDESGIGCIDVRGDGLVAVGGERCSVHLYASDGQLIWAAETYKYPYSVRFSPDGRWLLVATWDAYLYCVSLDVLPLGMRHRPYELPYPDAGPDAEMPYLDALFLPDGRIAFCTAAEDGHAVHLYRERQSSSEHRFAAAAVHALALAPDGRALAGGGNDQALFVWDAADLRLIGRHDLRAGADPAWRSGVDGYPGWLAWGSAAGPRAVFSLAWRDPGAILVGTAGGSVLSVAVPPAGGDGGSLRATTSAR